MIWYSLLLGIKKGVFHSDIAFMSSCCILHHESDYLCSAPKANFGFSCNTAFRWSTCSCDISYLLIDSGILWNSILLDRFFHVFNWEEWNCFCKKILRKIIQQRWYCTCNVYYYPLRKNSFFNSLSFNLTDEIINTVLNHIRL